MLVIHVYHVVGAGDTMLEIALQYKLNFAQLLVLNPLVGEKDINKIQMGELIRIQ